MHKIYLDNAATTPIAPEVIEAMTDLMKNHFGNPSSIHSFGREAKVYLEKARKSVADIINAEPEEIFFTSGGTEADNLAIIGLADRQGKGHLITTAVEHHAVLDTCIYLSRHGFELTILGVDSYGMIDPEELKKAIRPDTFLVSVMHANNEVGTINPIEEIGRITREAGVLLHVDAVQSVGKIPVDVKKLGIDMLSLSAHKINGPKGCGALYKRKGVELTHITHGGGQERKMRSGTENLPGIVGLGVAADLAASHLEENIKDWQAMRDHLIKRVLSEIPDTKLNGHPTIRLPHNANLSFNYIEGEALLLHLDNEGIACSTGSACSSGSMEPSYVLKAMGLADGWMHSALRFSIGMGNTMEDMDRVADVLKAKTESLRQASPFTPK